jgi:hypothetical protein
MQHVPIELMNLQSDKEEERICALVHANNHIMATYRAMPWDQQMLVQIKT